MPEIPTAEPVEGTNAGATTAVGKRIISLQQKMQQIIWLKSKNRLANDNEKENVNLINNLPT